MHNDAGGMSAAFMSPSGGKCPVGTSSLKSWNVAAAAALVCAIGVTGVLLYKPDSLTQLASSFSGKTEISTLEGVMPGENSSIAQRDETNVVEQSEAGLETLTHRQQVLKAKDMAAEIAEDEFAGERSLGGSANGQFETPPDRPLLDASANEFGEFGEFAKAAGPGVGSGADRMRESENELALLA